VVSAAGVPADPQPVGDGGESGVRVQVTRIS
jgi:hypothetical protein